MTASERYWREITSDRTMRRGIWRMKYRTYRKLRGWELRS